MTDEQRLVHHAVGEHLAWCHVCREWCADRCYLMPDLGRCRCCAKA